MAKVEAILYGEEFEEDFAVTTLGNPSSLADAAIGDDAGAEILELPEDITIITQEQQPEEAVAQPIPMLDSRPRLSADALPPKPFSAGGGNGGLLSQERGRLHAARLAQFRVNQTGTLSGASAADARPIRPSEMKDEGGLAELFFRVWKSRRMHLVRDADGKLRGFAFLTFEDPASVYAVMIWEHSLTERPSIDPKRAIPREEHLRNTRYFVGGLAPHSTADSMRAFFSKYGKVVDATVMVDRETGRSKGFGFVTFEDNSNDGQLVEKLGLILDDKQIEVKTAQPRSQRDQQRVGHTATSPTASFNNTQVATTNAAPMGSSMPFMSKNNPGAGDMSVMYQRMMSGMGTPYGAMMGGGMGMGMMPGFNPMMGMSMGRFGMGGMGGVGAMNPMAAATAGNMAGGNMGMGAAGGVGGMRLGMGPIGMGGTGAGMGGMVAPGAAGGMGGAAAAAGAGMGAAAMGMGMGMRQGMGMMGGGGVGRGRPGMNQGPGPARVTNRGQHGFHPYAR
ncbi:hypothetical protein EI94DRAFT_1829932 [Lactarius quietus]|nr:hypothetical protein EI94DRAFT_1829932 [Lactarius quietus]